ncbi:unnamed protein product [Ambrosiozyma monospora]|uniref:Unnamed protein product n=1 Tax=Ambrosiozyma monospora TaxID=43982 RepID=A0A9W6YXX8_AMBMO|nr:unnamed protein product [Ambrosiozyma monospora]
MQLNRFLFELSWKDKEFVDFIPAFNQFDPLLPQNIKNFPMDVDMSDPAYLNFVWTLASKTKFFYHLPLQTDEATNEFLDNLYKLGTEFPIVQSVTSFACSILMKQIYSTHNMKDRADYWDEQVRLNVLKQCIDLLDERVDTTTNFAEMVTLSFASYILFACNLSSPTWRTQFESCHALLVRARQMFNEVKNRYNALHTAALKILNLVSTWFHGAQFYTQISSDDGCDIPGVVNYANFETFKGVENNGYTIATSQDGFSLAFGYSLKLGTLLNQIYGFIYQMKREEGVNLGGSNLLKYFFSNKTRDIEAQVKVFGYELNMQLQKLNLQYHRFDYADFRRNATLKNTELILKQTLELYINIFYIAGSPQKITELKKQLYVSQIQDVLELFISTPYHSTAGAASHWCLYICAVISLLFNETRLVNHFMECFQLINKNGIYSVERSLLKLKHLKTILVTKNYDGIVDPTQDFVQI